MESNVINDSMFTCLTRIKWISDIIISKLSFILPPVGMPPEK